MHRWFESPPGRYLLAWEQARIDEAVADMFGYHSLQVGMPLLDGLRANRMPHRWRALDAWPEPGSDESPAPDLLAHAAALPFPDNSLDLVLLPHALELSQDPHTALREVARVLRPRGLLYVSEPVYAGPLNEVIRLFNDEGVVRAAAQAALDAALASGAWEAMAERRFEVPVHFADFADFEVRMMRPTYADHHLDEAKVRTVQAAFLPHCGADGAHFTRPMHVRLLRKTH